MNNSYILRIVSMLVFLVTFGVGLVVYNSAFDGEPPIEDIVADYTITRTKDFYLIGSNSTVEASANFTANINKLITNKDTGYQIELQVGSVDYEEGTNNIHRMFYLPLSTPSGTYCVKTIMRWRPQFSLLDKKISIKHGCFAINGQ